MTGYTRKWNCKQCGKPQESIDWPKIELCESCERKLDAPDLGSVGVRCGLCGSDDVRMLACPEHEWAYASVCHGCMSMCLHENVGWDGEFPQDRENEYGEGHCPECGYPSEALDA